MSWKRKNDLQNKKRREELSGLSWAFTGIECTQGKKQRDTRRQFLLYSPETEAL